MKVDPFELRRLRDRGKISEYMYNCIMKKAFPHTLDSFFQEKTK